MTKIRPRMGFDSSQTTGMTPRFAAAFALGQRPSEPLTRA